MWTADLRISRSPASWTHDVGHGATLQLRPLTGWLTEVLAITGTNAGDLYDHVAVAVWEHNAVGFIVSRFGEEKRYFLCILLISILV